MMKKIAIVCMLCAFVFVATPSMAAPDGEKGASADAFESASDNAVFNKVSDFFSTIGKKGIEKEAILKKRETARELKRNQRNARKEARKAEKEMRKKANDAKGKIDKKKKAEKKKLEKKAKQEKEKVKKESDKMGKDSKDLLKKLKSE